MPKKVMENGNGRNQEWKGYVNWNPTAAEREKVLAYMGHKNWTATGELATLNESGYTVSFSCEEGGSAYRVAVTGKTRPCPNIGYTLSIRASSHERLLGLVGFYCNIVCDHGDWLVDKKGEELW